MEATSAIASMPPCHLLGALEMLQWKWPQKVCSTNEKMPWCPYIYRPEFEYTSQIPSDKYCHLLGFSCRRVFSNAHTYHINSISVNSDGETYISADDLRINLWHLGITDQSFSILLHWALLRGVRGQIQFCYPLTDRVLTKMSK